MSRDRPWPNPGYKLGFRALFASLVLVDLFTVTAARWWWLTVLVCAFQVGIWFMIELSWLRHYDNWVASRAVDNFLEAAHAGAVFAECPKCGEQGIQLRELFHHLRLMHPDVELSDAAPDIGLSVPKPPLWVRLW